MAQIRQRRHVFHGDDMSAHNHGVLDGEQCCGVSPRCGFDLNCLFIAWPSLQGRHLSENTVKQCSPRTVESPASEHMNENHE